MQREIKTLDIQQLGLKMSDDGAMKFSGYASKFGGVDSYGDTIQKGAYQRTLKERERPIMMLYNHFGNPIGKWLKMLEDDVGLYVEGELTPGHSKASDVYASMKHGTLGGMSIGYYVRALENISENRRLLTDIELVEVSVVDTPADLGATIDDVKTALDECKSLKEIESLLREAGGFSKSEAVSLVARIKAFGRSESDQEKQKAEELKAIFQNLKL